MVWQVQAEGKSRGNASVMILKLMSKATTWVCKPSKNMATRSDKIDDGEDLVVRVESLD